MGAASWWHWAIVIAVVLILFGGKKIPELMKGIGTGIKGFKKAIKDDDEESSSVASTSQPQISQKVSQATKGRTRSKSSSTKTSASKATASVSAASSSGVDSPKKRGRSKKA